MKQIITLIFIISISSLFGQEKYYAHDYLPGVVPSYKPAYQDDYPDWAKMLYQEDLNYYQIEEAYLEWKTLATKEFRPIERYYKLWRQQALVYVAEDGRILESKQEEYYKNVFKTNTQTGIVNVNAQKNLLEWKFLGPKETFWLNESGSTEEPKACPWQVNVYSIEVAKTNHEIIYCGTETGFVSKSIDKGDTWQLLGQNYSFGGGVTALAIHPTNTDMVFAAAGRQIHRTMDGGLNWQPLLSGNALFYADKLLIQNETDVFAAGSSGVFKSKDMGETWIHVLDLHTYDLHAKPNDENSMYAISNQNGQFRIAVSSDGGESFQSDPNFPNNIQDQAGGLIAVSAANPDLLLSILLAPNNTPLLYRGNMQTGVWDRIATGQTNAFPMDNGQGFFDLVLEVSPIDSELIFAGTSTLYKSINGGSNFSIIGGYGGNFPIHPDIQSMQILDNGTTWVATDGGITFSTDNFTSPQNAIAKNRNLVGSHMWGFDQGWNEDLIVGGRYHNGNMAIADFYNAKALRMGGAESPTGWIMKGRSKHVTFNDLGPGWVLPETAEAKPQGRFVFSKYPNMDEYGGRRGNLLFHPNYHEVIYLGEENGFWKSNDMGTSFELLHDFGARVRFCQISFNNPNVIYADVVDRGLFKSEDGGYSWEAKPSLTNGMNGTSYWRGKLHFEISPNDENIIYACLQNGSWTADKGKIFKSKDGGVTWEDWTGSLDEFTKSLVVQPDAEGRDILYVFTNYNSGRPGQCFVRKDGDLDWATFGDSYPAGIAPNHALAFFRDSKIRVAGNGGIWENSLEEPNFKPIIQPWVERPLYDCNLDTLQFDDHSILNHDNVTWTWNISPTPLYIDDANKRNPKVVLGTSGSYDVSLSVIKDGEMFSKTIENMVTAIDCPSLESCSNPGFIPKASWNLIYVDSEETGQPGLATMAFDGNPETIWHTRWSSGTDPYPHEIQVDLGAEFYIHEFTYLPRQVGQNGRINDFELYFSQDGIDWGAVDTLGQFENSASPQTLNFPAAKLGRYFKLRALSEVNGGPWTSIAELDIKACYSALVSTKDLVNFKALKAFPVPTRGDFKISLPGKSAYKYSIFTMAGALVDLGESEQKQEFLELDVSHLKSGMYLIRLTDSNNIIYNVKVIKED